MSQSITFRKCPNTVNFYDLLNEDWLGENQLAVPCERAPRSAVSESLLVLLWGRVLATVFQPLVLSAQQGQPSSTAEPHRTKPVGDFLAYQEPQVREPSRRGGPGRCPASSPRRERESVFLCVCV